MSSKVSVKMPRFSAGKSVKMPKIKTMSNLFNIKAKGKR